MRDAPTRRCAGVSTRSPVTPTICDKVQDHARKDFCVSNYWPHDLTWKKSSHSVGDGACVEVANCKPLILVRHSKQPMEEPVLLFNHAVWRVFIESNKARSAIKLDLRGSIIALLSIVISCIALLGVAYSLTMQALQLRASQLQISRATQLEVVKMVIDNPELLSGSVDSSDPAGATRIGSFLNFRLKQLELSYSVKAISSESVRLQARIIFAEGYPVKWWRSVREIYETEAVTRRERQFFTMSVIQNPQVIEKKKIPRAASNASR